MKAIILSSLFLSIAIGFAMKRVWGLINFLQIVTSMPILTVKLPMNFRVLMKTLKDVSNMKLIPRTLVYSTMKQISVAGDAFGEIGDIVIGLVALAVIVIFMTVLYYLFQQFKW